MAFNFNPFTGTFDLINEILKYFTERESTTSPNNIVNVDSLTAKAASTNADIALVVKGAGALLATVPDDTIVGGAKRGVDATDWQRTRSSSTQVASGIGATIIGGRFNTASGNGAVVGGNTNTASGLNTVVTGGNSNTASSSYSFVGGGQTNNAQTNTHATVCGGNSNTASGPYSFVGGGQTNNAQTNTHATVCGGNSNTASGQYTFIGGGFSNSASGNQGSVVCGGTSNTANGVASFVSGGQYGTARSISGYHVFPACWAPIASSTGVTQSALLLLGRQTTDATATVLTSNAFAASATNQVILPNNSAYSFSGEVIAGVTGGGNTARWTIDGAIKRGATAASTAMVGTPTVTMTHNDAGAAAWIVAVTTDTTNGGISVTVTGAAATTIRWVAKINTTEMTF